MHNGCMDGTYLLPIVTFHYGQANVYVYYFISQVSIFYEMELIEGIVTDQTRHRSTNNSDPAGLASGAGTSVLDPVKLFLFLDFRGPGCHFYAVLCRYFKQPVPALLSQLK